MSAGDCHLCGGDGIYQLHKWPRIPTKSVPVRCPDCDGTGKRGWVRVLTRIKRWFQRWGYDGWN